MSAASSASAEVPAPPAPIRAEARSSGLRAAIYALYDLAWCAALVLTSPWWLARAAVDRPFRALCAERIGRGRTADLPGAKPRLLVHAVSVGEVKAARSLIRAVLATRPDLHLVVSCVTDTGLAVARTLYPEASVVRFPFDVSFAVERFLAHVDPCCVVLVELEMWPGFLRRASARGIPLAIVNGRITEKSCARYRRLERVLPQFDRLSLVCAQDADHAARFERLGVDPARIVITGNIKADGLRVGMRAPDEALRALLGGTTGQRVIVAGSTHAPEEELLVRAWRDHFRDARLVIVPRHPERSSALVRELEAFGSKPQLLTSLRAGERVDVARALIVDTIGELEDAYALADLVFVGGSLSTRGGQNMLEPAAQGKAVVYGPGVSNFTAEAQLLESAGAAHRLAQASELGPVLARLLADPTLRANMGKAGLAAVSAQSGATRATADLLFERVLT